MKGWVLPRRKGHLHITIPRFPKKHPFRLQPGHRPRAAHPDGLPLQQFSGYSFDSFRLHHMAVLLFRPTVHGEQPPPICGRGNHRASPSRCRDSVSQPIGPAQVAAEQGDHKPSSLIHHHHSGVCGFALHIGGNGPNGNSHSAYKYQALVSGKRLSDPVTQRAVYPAAGCRAPQNLGQPLGQGIALGGKRRKSQPHSDALRNSVEKSGAYNRLRV